VDFNFPPLHPPDGLSLTLRLFLGTGFVEISTAGHSYVEADTKVG